MSWIFFALLAPLFWVISNFFDKFALTKITRGVADFVFFGSIGNFLLLVGLIIFHGYQPLPFLVVLSALAAGFLLNYSYFLYGKALSGEDTSEIVPLFQMIPVFVLILGFLFFGENITFMQFIGFLTVFFGVVVLSIRKLPNANSVVKPEFWLMLVASILVSFSFILTDYVLEHTSILTAMVYDVSGFVAAAFSLFLYRPWRVEIIRAIKEARPKKYLLFFGNDGADILAQLAMRVALIGAPAAGLVSVVGSIQPLYALILGYGMTRWVPHIIKEDITGKTFLHRLFSIVFILTGIILVSL